MAGGASRVREGGKRVVDVEGGLAGDGNLLEGGESVDGFAFGRHWGEGMGVGCG